jgi:hypothetical protein
MYNLLPVVAALAALGLRRRDFAVSEEQKGRISRMTRFALAV